MFRVILWTQWKGARAVVLLATVLGFALPILSLQVAGDAYGPAEFIALMQRFGVGYALLAAGLGLLIALLAWAPDQRGRHVYALTLPVSRARYVLMRMAAGALFLAPVAGGVLLAGLLVTAVGAIPAGLQAHPFALTMRFVLAALVAYAVFFAVASATQRTAGIVLGSVAAVLLAQYVLTVLDVRYNLLGNIGDLLFDSPGLFSVFTGRWTLIDA